jgi:hypothetical protein
MKFFPYFFLVAYLMAYFIPAEAQYFVGTAGGDATGTVCTASYSVGQLVYTTDYSTTGSVAKGVQQPYEISVITEDESAKEIDLVCLVYPNPVDDFLTLKIENNDRTNLVYNLLDFNGTLISLRKISGNDITINMGNLISSVYFLKILDNNRVIRTFKIIKR